MAHQTSTIQRKQTTQRSIGRLMDVDFFGAGKRRTPASNS
jgi:hypothetical protein